MGAATAARLGRKLGDGAGGVVYQHAQDSSLAIKVLNNPKPRDIDRLTATLTLGIPSDVPGSRARLAWPIELQHNSRGEVCGFVMPIAAGVSPVILANIMNRRERRALAGNLGFNLLLHYAAASCAVIGHYHDYNVIVGDLNERNLMASGDGWVSGIDTDSVQFSDSLGNQYLNGYHTPEFLAPELVNVDLAHTPRRKCHDDFALAVIVFMLLSDGWHPFAGVPRHSHSVNQVANASNGYFAYPGNCSALAPPKGAPPWEVIPSRLAVLLERTFTAGTDGTMRTRAWDLHDAATRSLGELSLCNGAEQHYYPREQSTCPWCSYYGTIRGPQPKAHSPRVKTNSRGGPYRPPGAWGQPTRAATPPPRSASSTGTSNPFPLGLARRAAVWATVVLGVIVALAIALGGQSSPSSQSPPNSPTSTSPAPAAPSSEVSGAGSSGSGTSGSAPATPAPATSSSSAAPSASSTSPAPSTPSAPARASGPPRASGPSAIIADHYRHIANGEASAAFMLFSPHWRSSHPGWRAQREAAQPHLDLRKVGPSHIDGGVAYVYVRFVARDTVAVPGSDTACRRFAGWARLVRARGHWRYEPAGQGLAPTVLPSDLRECQ